MSKYIYLDSFSFKNNMYIENRACDFLSNILQPDLLSKNLWEVALTEIDWLPSSFQFSEDVYIMTNIVRKNTQVGNFTPEILRILRQPTVFKRPYYMDLSCDYIDAIRIYIRKGDNTEPDNESLTSLRCTLHFRKKRST